MLQASGRKSRVITGVSKEGNALFLTSEAGIIRLIPQTEGVIRVSWTENGSFAKEQGVEYADLSDSFTYRYSCKNRYSWLEMERK